MKINILRNLGLIWVVKVDEENRKYRGVMRYVYNAQVERQGLEVDVVKEPLTSYRFKMSLR